MVLSQKSIKLISCIICYTFGEGTFKVSQWYVKDGVRSKENLDTGTRKSLILAIVFAQSCRTHFIASQNFIYTHFASVISKLFYVVKYEVFVIQFWHNLKIKNFDLQFINGSYCVIITCNMRLDSSERLTYHLLLLFIFTSH